MNLSQGRVYLFFIYSDKILCVLLCWKTKHFAWMLLISMLITLAWLERTLRQLTHTSAKIINFSQIIFCVSVNE